MKKLLIIILALALVMICAAGCGGSNDSDDSAAGAGDGIGNIVVQGSDGPPELELKASAAAPGLDELNMPEDSDSDALYSASSWASRGMVEYVPD